MFCCVISAFHKGKGVHQGINGANAHSLADFRCNTLDEYGAEPVAGFAPSIFGSGAADNNPCSGGATIIPFVVPVVLGDNVGYFG